MVGNLDIVLQTRSQLNTSVNGSLDTIPVNHCMYDHLCYVFLLPYVTDRCHLGRRCQVVSARQSEGKHMCPLIFYANPFFQRPCQFNTIRRGGRLFQQYFVDQ